MKIKYEINKCNPQEARKILLGMDYYLNQKEYNYEGLEADGKYQIWAHDTDRNAAKPEDVKFNRVCISHRRVFYIKEDKDDSSKDEEISLFWKDRDSLQDFLTVENLKNEN